MTPYLYGLLTFPVAIAVIWLTGYLFVRAWDAWESLLKRSAPKWYPVEANADLGASLGTYSGRVLRIGFPGGGAFVLTDRGHMSSAKVRTRAKWAIWKAMQDGEDAS